MIVTFGGHERRNRAEAVVLQPQFAGDRGQHRRVMDDAALDAGFAALYPQADVRRRRERVATDQQYGIAVARCRKQRFGLLNLCA